jgi:hypothetical protein
MSTEINHPFSSELPDFDVEQPGMALFNDAYDTNSQFCSLGGAAPFVPTELPGGFPLSPLGGLGGCGPHGRCFRARGARRHIERARQQPHQNMWQRVLQVLQRLETLLQQAGPLLQQAGPLFRNFQTFIQNLSRHLGPGPDNQHHPPFNDGRIPGPNGTYSYSYANRDSIVYNRQGQPLSAVIDGHTYSPVPNRPGHWLISSNNPTAVPGPVEGHFENNPPHGVRFVRHGALVQFPNQLH